MISKIQTLLPQLYVFAGVFIAVRILLFKVKLAVKVLRIVLIIAILYFAIRFAGAYFGFL